MLNCAVPDDYVPPATCPVHGKIGGISGTVHDHANETTGPAIALAPRNDGPINETNGAISAHCTTKRAVVICPTGARRLRPAWSPNPGVGRHAKPQHQAQPEHAIEAVTWFMYTCDTKKTSFLRSPINAVKSGISAIGGAAGSGRLLPIDIRQLQPRSGSASAISVSRLCLHRVSSPIIIILRRGEWQE